MTHLASWGKLTYSMESEEGPDSHIVLVQDQSGRYATFHLEKGCQIFSSLKPQENNDAMTMIHDLKDEFLSYWIELKQASGR